MKFKQRQNSGFTLVELVMVMVIIGLLAAVIMPRFTSQRDRAAIAATKSHLESLRTAVALFYAQEGRPPNATLTELYTGIPPANTSYIKEIPKDIIDPPGTESVLGPPGGGVGGWVYDPATVEVTIDRTGSDPVGQPYSEY